MSNYEDSGNGALFKNDSPTSDRAPHYKGTLSVKCPSCKEESEHWVSSWVKKARSGMNYMSMALQNKTPKLDEPRQDVEEEDMPF